MNLTQLKAPDWRWQQAKLYVAAQQSGQNCTQPDDPLVVYVIRMLKAMQQPKSRQFIKAKMPQLYRVLQLGSSKHDSAMRATLQISLLSETPDQIQWLDPIQVRFYRDIFFDLPDKNQQVQQWLQDQVLGTVRSKAMSRLHRARKLAITHGADVARQSLSWGQASGKVKDALIKMFKNQRVKSLADYCMVQQTADPTTMANIMHTTYNKIQDRQLQRQLKQDPGAQDKSLTQLAHGIQRAIRTYTAAQIDAAQKQSGDDAQPVIDTLKQVQ